MLYVKVAFPYNQCKAKLQEAWGNRFEDYIGNFKRGLANAFQSLPAQMETVFKREGFQNSHLLKVALEINVSSDGAVSGIDIFVAPYHGDSNALFPVVFDLPLEYKLDFSGKDSPIIGGRIYTVAQRLAADLARDGFPKEMKRSIADLAKFFEKYPPCRKLDDFSVFE